MGFLNRREKARGPETISQLDFMENTLAALGKAEDVTVSPQEALNSAEAVKDNLTAIRAGRLVVQPALEASQIERFMETAGTIIGMGRKMVEDLASTGQGRPAAQATASSSFKGSGSGVKK